MIKQIIITDIVGFPNSTRVQEKLFKLGNYWHGTKNKELNVESLITIFIDEKGSMTQTNDSSFLKRNFKEFFDYNIVTAEMFLSENWVEPMINYTLLNPYCKARNFKDLYREELLNFSWQINPRSEHVYKIQKEMFDNLNYYVDPIFKLEFPREEKTFNNKPKLNLMDKILKIGKDIIKNLSAEESMLRDCGLHDENGENTSTAKTILNEKYYNSDESQSFLLQIAKKAKEEEKK